MTFVSASAGAEGSPSSLAASPACATALPITTGSSECWLSGRPSRADSTSAARMTSSSATAEPSSLSSATPAAASPLRSASSRPARPTVIVPMGRTRTLAPDAALRFTDSINSGESRGGSVLGMAQTVVNPPLAAARVPLSMVSLCSCPGSRRWQCRSMNPGATIMPVASIRWIPDGTSGLLPVPTCVHSTRPSCRKTSPVASRSCHGSITRPPLMRTGSREPDVTMFPPYPLAFLPSVTYWKAHKRVSVRDATSDRT